MRSLVISIVAVVPFVAALAAIPLPISDWRYWAVLLTAAWWRTVAPYADRKSK
ncbi:hypothetical protein [Aurantimonas coralicida]|uniref:hypothetical protein n=1 Tax=Aurantimonas coralicida TaxID=182270 RepID=UPI001D19774D|nr:hypothetical protein [Aurantimonas coralicida]MCC4296271.1 hypothetical protein [Aurantimonas coralicida]